MSKELWQIQEHFTRRFWETRGGMPKDEPALTIATKDYLLHLMKEVTEVLDQISFKMHRGPKDFVDRGNVLEEMIDCQKFLWGLMQIWDFTYEDFDNELRRKSIVVEQRFTQERAMKEFKDAPCVLIDIDGVLSDYPKCYHNWLANKFGCSAYNAEVNLRDISLDRKEELKREYRQSGVKATLPVLPGAKNMLDSIHAAGLKIILLTNRPYAEHCRIYADTLQWLRDNDLKYDAIIWARDKGFEAVKNFKNVCWAVDDSEENVKRLREAGIQTVHLIPGSMRNTEHFSLFLSGMVKDMRTAGTCWNTISHATGEFLPL